MNERLKSIRKMNKLSQESFGKRIGVSRDVINNLERGRVEIKDHMVKLVCCEFGINERWLRTGDGKMLRETESKNRQFEVVHPEMSPTDKMLIDAYFSLSNEQREAFLQYCLNVAEAYKKKKEETPAEKQARLFREEADAVEEDAEKSSALPFTKDA